MDLTAVLQAILPSVLSLAKVTEPWILNIKNQLAM